MTTHAEPDGPPPYYPVLLDLRDAPCLVVGGGAVACRKAAGLCAAGARVTVVAPAAWQASSPVSMVRVLPPTSTAIDTVSFILTFLDTRIERRETSPPG